MQNSFSFPTKLVYGFLGVWVISEGLGKGFVPYGDITYDLEDVSKFAGLSKIQMLEMLPVIWKR